MKPGQPLQKATPAMALIVACSLMFSVTTVGAQHSLEQEQKALNMIADFADRICKDVPLQGKGNKLELTGKAKAELRGIVKEFADLGLEGAAKYEESKYEGLLQSDLSKALQDSSNCKLKVFDSLKDKLLSPKATVVLFKPNSPSGLRINWEEGKGIRIAWTDNSINELGFNIYRKYESASTLSETLPPLTGKAKGYEFIRTVPANTTKYFDRELYFFERGDRVTYQITSYNETGESEKIELQLVVPKEIVIE